METAVAIEPLGFFTRDTLRAGWYFTWRLTLYTLPYWLVPAVAGALVVFLGLPDLVGVLLGLAGFIATIVVSIRLTTTIASRWASERYGAPLGRGVWWAITWRAVLVMLAAGFALNISGGIVFGFVASLWFGVSGASPAVVVASLASASMVVVIGLMILLAVSVNVVVLLLAYGWAMSTAVANQLGNLVVATAPLIEAPVTVPAVGGLAGVTVGVAAETPAGRVAVSPPAAPRAAAGPSSDRAVQCPKCGLYETERGSVIGWYCRVCGWRESRR